MESERRLREHEVMIIKRIFAIVQEGLIQLIDS